MLPRLFQWKDDIQKDLCNEVREEDKALFLTRKVVVNNHIKSKTAR